MDHRSSKPSQPPPANREQPIAARAVLAPLQGAILALIQFDVCEEIKLDELRKLLGARTAEASFKHQAPGYVRFRR